LLLPLWANRLLSHWPLWSSNAAEGGASVGEEESSRMGAVHFALAQVSFCCAAEVRSSLQCIIVNEGFLFEYSNYTWE